MMNKLLGAVRVRHLLTVALIAFGLPLLTMGPASAHTPNLAKDCYGITVSGSAYETRDTNTLGIRIDGGDWTTKTFGTSGSLTVPLPQDGQVHSYDAYVHTTNHTASYSKDYSGTIRACGKTHVTAVLFEKTDPTCAADGALVTKTEPAGITVHKTPSGTGPGHYTITFEAQTGYAIDGPTSQTIDVLPKLTGDQCATVVQPVTPTITDPACTGPGTGTPGSFTLPVNGGGISYSKAGNVVTATADATHKFASLPSGWTPVDAHHATYTVGYQTPDGYPACLDELPTPVPPVASAPTCDTDGDLVVGTTPHVVTKVDDVLVTQDTHVGPGSHVLTYTAASGYTFADGTTTSFPVEVLGMTLDCPATPANPSVTQSVCTGPGTSSEPVIVFGDVEGDHITYVYDDVTHVVTATPDAGFALVDLPDGWASGQGGTATYQVTLTDPGPCLVPVDVPVAPVPADPTCDTDGSLTVSPTDHVVTRVDGTVITEETSFGPGDHEIGYAPAAGYTFAGEVQTTFTRTVAAATADCPVTPVAPTLTQSVCTGAGTHSDPVVTFGDLEGDHITYVYDPSGEFAGAVTATAEAGFALADLPEGWVWQEDGTATYAVTFTDPGDCAVTVVSPPTSPTVVEHPQPPASLPNTGGTSGWLPVSGLALVLAGGALVARDRRRRAS
jgi:LPXTG-motif cell wall-anchored protein